MKHNYTFNFLIKYLYGETSILRKLEIENAIDENEVVKNEYKKLKKSYKKLPKVSFYPTDKTIKNISSQKPRAVPIPLESVANSIGAVVEVKFKDGNQYSGKLIGASEDSFTIEQAASGGIVSYEYTFDKIDSVVRYTKPKPIPKPVENAEPILAPDMPAEQ